MKNALSFISGILFCTSAFANTYFVSPSGNGTQDGSSWDNATACEDIDAVLSTLEAGDIIYFQAGTYGGSSTDVVPGLTVIGGFPSSAKGTDVSGYNPYLNLTIFDCEGKNVNAEKAYVRVVATDAQKNLTTTIKGITITGAKSVFPANGSRNNQYIVGSAFYCANAKVILEDVLFKGNTSAIGGVVSAGENAKFLAKHCKWIDNVNDYWTHFPDANAGFTSVCYTALPSIIINPGRTTSILDGCVFTGNKIEGDSKNKTKWGGLINIVDRTNDSSYSKMSYADLIAINNIFDGSDLEIFQKGGCLRQGMRSYIFMAYNTIYGFKASDPSVGTTISIHGDNVLAYMGCNIVVDDCKTINNNYAIGLDNNLRSSSGSFTYTSTSFGYNTVSGITPNKTPQSFFTVSTDQWNVANGEMTVFGSNKLTEKGNTMVIEPLSPYADVNTEAVSDAFKDTDFPNDFIDVFGDEYHIDLTMDITGAKRNSTTYRGAYDASIPDISVGILEKNMETPEINIKRISECQYIITGMDNGLASVYDYTGKVLRITPLQRNNIIDLSEYNDGIYIIRIADKSFKIFK